MSIMELALMGDAKLPPYKTIKGRHTPGTYIVLKGGAIACLIGEEKIDREEGFRYLLANTPLQLARQTAQPDATAAAQPVWDRDVARVAISQKLAKARFDAQFEYHLNQLHNPQAARPAWRARFERLQLMFSR